MTILAVLKFLQDTIQMFYFHLNYLISEFNLTFLNLLYNKFQLRLQVYGHKRL